MLRASADGKIRKISNPARLAFVSLERLPDGWPFGRVPRRSAGNDAPDLKARASCRSQFLAAGALNSFERTQCVVRSPKCGGNVASIGLRSTCREPGTLRVRADERTKLFDVVFPRPLEIV